MIIENSLREECSKNVNGFSGAQFKKFPTVELARAFINDLSANSNVQRSSSFLNHKLKRKYDESCPLPPLLDGSPAGKVKKTHVVESKKPYIANDGQSIVYTDGACFNNGSKFAKAGIGVYWGKDSAYNIAEPLAGRQTNNRAEIHAAVRALEQAKERGLTKLTIRTDSNFLKNSYHNWVHILYLYILIFHLSR